jgi:hypothetical protein
MAEEKGIKETKEALLATATVGAFVIKRLKDGLQLDDAIALGTALLLDGEFKTLVLAGVSGVDQIPAEIKDISLAEALELAKEIPRLIDIIKGA